MKDLSVDLSVSFFEQYFLFDQIIESQLFHSIKSWINYQHAFTVAPTFEMYLD